MADFIPYIRQRLEASGYEFTKRFADLDLFMRSPEKQDVWICYLGVEITPEQIRRMFDYTGHVLIVVDEKLMPAEIVDRDSTPMWLRVLHGLYMGRVYTWNGRHLYGLHFDYDTGDVSESGAIQPDELLLVETGTWLRGWTGTYRLARFYDKQWWNEPGDSGYKSAGRQAYEQARDEYQRQQQRENRQERAYYAPPKQASTGRDFMREFMTCGSKAAARTLYKQLAKEFHPDLSGRDSTAEMQQINLAYEKAERMYI